MYLIGMYDLLWNDYVGRDAFEEELGKDATKQCMRIFRAALSGGRQVPRQVVKQCFPLILAAAITDAATGERLNLEPGYAERSVFGDLQIILFVAFLLVLFLFMTVCACYGCMTYLQKSRAVANQHVQNSEGILPEKITEPMQEKVWATHYGRHYHLKNCKWLLKSKNVVQMTVTEANKKDLKKCLTCHGGRNVETQKRPEKASCSRENDAVTKALR